MIEEFLGTFVGAGLTFPLRDNLETNSRFKTDEELRTQKLTSALIGLTGLLIPFQGFILPIFSSAAILSGIDGWWSASKELNIREATRRTKEELFKTQ